MKTSTLAKYYGNDRAAKVIYGSILIFAYLLTQDHNNNASALALVSGTFFAAVAIVLAEIYAEILGKTIRQKKRLNKQQRTEVEKDSLAIVSVSFWPSFFFLLSYLGVFSVQMAFNISYVLLLAILFMFNYSASRLSEQSKLVSIVMASLVTAIGLIIIIAKYTLGH